MSFPWAICLARTDAAALGELRLWPELEVAETTTEVWLRGRTMGEALIPKLAALPARERYEWLPDTGRLRPVDSRIPSARFPSLSWQPLRAWAQVAVSASAPPAAAPSPVALRLERSGAEQEPELLLTTLAELSSFVATAPLVRLQRLQFAASADGNVLVQGRPLPPVPGRRYVRHGRVAVPAGFGWQPAVSPEVLSRCYSLGEEAWALWHEDGTFTPVQGEQFIPLTRSAVRATREQLPEKT